MSKVRTFLFAILLMLFSTQSWAATYYVATNGTGTNSGHCATATSSTPTNAMANIQAALPCLSSGDTLKIHGGLYQTTANIIYNNLNGTPMNVPPNGGGSFASATIIETAGTGTVTIKPPFNVSGINLNGATADAYSYMIFRDLVIDNSLSTGGDGVGIFLHNSHHIRFDNITQHSSYNFGYSISLTSHHNEVLGGFIYNNGWEGSEITNGHGIYMTGCDNLISGVQIYNNHGYGIHAYNNAGSHDCPSRNHIAYNKIYNNCRHGSPCYGLVINWGSVPNWVYNNFIYGNTGGIQDYTESTNTKIYGNTVANNGCDGGIVSQYFTQRADIQLNIVYNNCSGSANIVNHSPSDGTQQTPQNNITSSPVFSDPTGGDYTLANNTSSAWNAGTCPTGLNDDFFGTARPISTSCDAGAHELGVAGSNPHITTTVLSDGQDDQAYSDTASVTDGVPPYVWTLSAGTLPTGLSLSGTTTSTVTLSGTPTTPGVYNFTLRVDDDDSGFDTQAFEVEIIAVDDGCDTVTVGAWTLIADTCVGGSSSNGTASPVTTSFNSTGATLGVCACVSDKAVADPTLGDSRTNTWNEIGDAEEDGEYGRLRFFYSLYSNPGTGMTVTYNTGGLSSYAALRCMSFSGNAVSPLDLIGLGNSVLNGTTVSGGTVVPGLPNSLVIVGGMMEASGVVTVEGFTTYQSGYSLDKAFGVLLGVQIQTEATSVTPQLLTSSPMSMSGNTITFRAPAVNDKYNFKRRR